MNTAKLSQFIDFLVRHYAIRGTTVQPWQGASRRTKNILEINGQGNKTLVYIKDRSEAPGFWGLNENQVFGLNKSNTPWFLVLLVGNSEEGYIFSDKQVQQGIIDSRWSRDKKEYKLHQGSELAGSIPFKTFLQALSILDPNSDRSPQNPDYKVLKEHPFSYSISESNKGVLEENERLIGNKEKRYTENKIFDPNNIIDGRERAIASIVRRRGQPKFRKILLEIYQGRCAITGTNAEHVLEAAHILPYKGEFTNHPTNGLLLRADLHTLFDLRLIAIDTTKMQVIISPALLDTSYRDIGGSSLHLPQRESDWPSKKALEIHRREAKL